MKKLLKLILITLMVFGLVFSIINFISIDTIASAISKDIKGVELKGTSEEGDECFGLPLDC